MQSWQAIKKQQCGRSEFLFDARAHSAGFFVWADDQLVSHPACPLPLGVVGQRGNRMCVWVSMRAGWVFYSGDGLTRGGGVCVGGYSGTSVSGSDLGAELSSTDPQSSVFHPSIHPFNNTGVWPDMQCQVGQKLSDHNAYSQSTGTVETCTPCSWMLVFIKKAHAYT